MKINKFIYRTSVESPSTEYERELVKHNNQSCYLVSWLGNGHYEVKFEDGKVFEVNDDELEEVEE